MDNDGFSSGEEGGDDVARLVALTERQHELWAELRDAQDDDVRNQLFDELSANREELAELKDVVSAQVDEPIPTPPSGEAETPRSVGETLRASLLTPPDAVAPAEPPPPPPPTTPPPVVEEEPAEPEQGSPSAAPIVPEPEDDDPEPSPPTMPEKEPLAPEETPFSSRDADLAATRGRRESSVVEQPEVQPEVQPASQPAPQPAPRLVDDEVLEKRRRAAHQAYQDLERVRLAHAKPFPIFAILVAIVAVGAVAWLLFFRSEEPSSTPAVTATTSASAEAAVDTSAVDQIRTVFDGLGYSSIMVEERNGTIYLAGVVASETDRTAAIGASEALASPTPVDGSGVTIGVVDQDLRAAALQAIADAGYVKINVSVAGGVATLTGVSPEDGSADLVAVVTSVDGINQVVDLTEAADRAEALDAELQRITAVTPIVFASGQSSLNALQERILDSAAEIIQAYEGPIVTVVGYTDSAGTPEENVAISLRRAEAVHDYLVTQGVALDRLTIDARGEASSSGSAAVAGLERRVEFAVGYLVTTGGDADFRIGIVAPSARDDLAFTQSIVDAVAVIAAERGGVAVDIADGLFVPEEAEAAIRAYAADGYDLVIAHGSQYGTSLAAIAPEFPNTAFAWGTAADTFGIPNVSAYEVSADEGGYVMGVAAALLTDSDVLGVVGPLEVGDAQLFVDGFRNGVLSTNAGANVAVTYTGSFSDVALAAEAATAHVAAGADVLTGTAQMVIGAVGVATENDALWFGTQANQAELAPSLVVASQVYHWEVALRQIVSGIEQGALGGQTYTLNLSNGGVIIEYNPGFALPADIREAADSAAEAIILGNVVTGV